MPPSPGRVADGPARCRPPPRPGSNSPSGFLCPRPDVLACATARGETVTLRAFPSALPQGPLREEGRAEQRSPRDCCHCLPQRTGIPAGDVPRACQADPPDRRRDRRRHRLQRRHGGLGPLPPRRGRGARRPRPVRPGRDGRPARPARRRERVGVAAARRRRAGARRAGAAARRGLLATRGAHPRPQAGQLDRSQPPPGGRLAGRPHRQGGAVSHQRYLRERHTMAALLKAVSLRRLPLTFLLAVVGGAFRALALALTGRPGDALQILWAWGWNVKELPVTLVHRRRMQHRRRADDAQLASLRAAGGQPLRVMLRGLLELVYGEVGEHVAQTPNAADEQDMPAPGAQIGRIIASHPLAFTLAGFALLMAVSLRSLLAAPAIAGGALGMFPNAGQDLLREFGAAFHQNGLGTTSSASPSLAVLGGLATLTFNKALLAQKLLLWLALPLAAASCTRALRVVVPSLPARAAAGLLYAGSPLAIGALAQGRLGELAFLVLAPPALAQVLLAFRRDQPREPWRPAVRFLLLAAVSIAMYPPAAVVYLVTVAVASVVALLRGRGDASRFAARQALTLGAGYLGALALLFPWTGQLLSGAALRSTGTALASPGFADLLQLRPGGPGLGAALVGPLYPALALAALFLVPAKRRRQTFWLLVGLLGVCVAVTLQVHGLPPGVARDWPAGLLVPGAVLWAAATGMAGGRPRGAPPRGRRRGTGPPPG